MGEGRELRLGLSGARPDGACEKTTTHWPTLQAGWHHSSGAPWSSFSTCSCCHLHGGASMWRSQASLRSALGPPQPPKMSNVCSSITICDWPPRGWGDGPAMGGLDQDHCSRSRTQTSLLICRAPSDPPNTTMVFPITEEEWPAIGGGPCVVTIQFHQFFEGE